MKRKFLIASHGNLAKGFQSSLDILADKGKELADFYLPLGLLC